MYNIAQTLTDVATRIPYRPAIIFPAGREREGRARYTQYSFQQLNQLCDSYAYGLSNIGVRRGNRTLLMVKPGVDLIAITFALLKIGAVPVLIDPGMGLKPFLQCVKETEPVVSITMPLAHLVTRLFPKSFGTIQYELTLAQLRGREPVKAGSVVVAPTTEESEAAITFTSGSTGIPKGVVYLHGMFKAQIEIFRDEVGIEEGEIDLPGLYIFALFNPALGVTTVIPDMDPRKPAQLNPAHLVEAIQTHGVTTSFGSPTIWKKVGLYCHEHNLKLPSMRRIFMASAPVPPTLVAQFNELLPNGRVYTPFGATEALPLTMIDGQELVRVYQDKSTVVGISTEVSTTNLLLGVCVGYPLKEMTINIISINDWAIEEWDDSLVLPPGKIGEIVVKGPVVTQLYINRPYQTIKAKIKDGKEVWHRMGDIGYFDKQGRLWFCGRKAHRVETEHGLMLPVPCEAVFNQHPEVARTALVGVGKLGQQQPVLVVEPIAGLTPKVDNKIGRRLVGQLLELGALYEHTRLIKDFMFHPSFPVDVRHNAKIQREKLAIWVARRRG